MPDRPISTTPKVRPDAPRQEPASRSPYAKPKVLMGEVAAPRGTEIAPQRDAFRAFMLSRRLSPTRWARAAGVAPGEVLAFLTGRARGFSPGAIEKLAAAAGATPQDLFG